MDDYPARLAPEFEEGGRVATPFPEWWARVSGAFPHVPECVAEQWLHRHWNQSPYGWMRSADYTFRMMSWDSARLSDIASGANDWEFRKTLERGKYLVERCPDVWLVRYMVEHQTTPRPLIVLDNSGGCLAGEKHAPIHHQSAPRSFLIIEGHTRFELAAHLHLSAKLDNQIKVWMIERIQEVEQDA